MDSILHTINILFSSYISQGTWGPWILSKMRKTFDDWHWLQPRKASVRVWYSEQHVTVMTQVTILRLGLLLETCRNNHCDALGQWSITLLLTPGPAILCWPCIIDWAMQEVIRLELCDVTWGCGGMVSLRGVGPVVTLPRLGRRLDEACCWVLEEVL